MNNDYIDTELVGNFRKNKRRTEILNISQFSSLKKRNASNKKSYKKSLDTSDAVNVELVRNIAPSAVE